MPGKDVFKRAEDFECSYPLCEKRAYAYAYWLNPKIPLCKEHFDLAQFLSWYIEKHEKRERAG